MRFVALQDGVVPQLLVAWQLRCVVLLGVVVPLHLPGVVFRGPVVELQGVAPLAAEI